MSRRSRIAHFKTPFLLSVAAPAALGVACGGRTDVADTIGNAGTSSVGNGGSAPILTPPTPACKGSAPPATEAAATQMQYNVKSNGIVIWAILALWLSN